MHSIASWEARAEGVMLAVIHVEDIWTPDREAEGKAVFGTTDEPPGAPPLVVLPLHKGAVGFMSFKQFEKFYWPTLERVPVVPGYQGASVEGFSRDDVDAYALQSQQRAADAWSGGYFAKSVVPVRDQNGKV